MENQTQQIADLLAANPEAAHFLADLTAGTPLPDAVRDHFGKILDLPAKSEPSETAAPSEPSPQPVTYTMPGAETDATPDAEPSFLSYIRPSFWD